MDATRTTYQVNEQFTSVQGEGYWSGRQATFIRLQGCTVGCPWCDSGPLADLKWGRQTNGLTRNTWGKGGERKTVEEIAHWVTTPHVVITGGEPTLYDLDPLILRLSSNYIQLETSGQNSLKGELSVDWLTWSPKETLKWDAPEDIKREAMEVKWVVDDNLQWETVADTFEWYRVHCMLRVPWFYLMPEGCPPRKETVEKTLSWLNGPVMVSALMQAKFRFGDRLQYRIGVR